MKIFVRRRTNVLIGCLHYTCMNLGFPVNSMVLNQTVIRVYITLRFCSTSHFLKENVGSYQDKTLQNLKQFFSKRSLDGRGQKFHLSAHNYE